MKTIIILMAVIFLTSCKNTIQKEALPGNGVSHELAVYRSRQVSDVTYRLSFQLPLKKEDSIPASLHMDVSVHDLSHPLYLDYKPDNEWPVSVSVNGKEIPAVFESEHLVIPAKFMGKGRNIIHVEFIAGETSLNRNEDYMYTLLVPDRARTLFPCFDQPDIKAVFILDITAPADWKVLGNAPQVSREEKGEFVLHRFRKTDNISTYLFSFVAGKFKEASNDKGAINMHMLYRETDENKIKASVSKIFELHRHAIDFMEQYTQYPFPFQKLDFAAIPGFQYGGMEHTGAIQYRESSLFLDSSATQSQELWRAKLIAHETSHMWFGNLVTMKWFDDVWLKEVFASLMADKIINPAFPEVNHDLQFMTAHYPGAYNVDRTGGANPIRQDLDNLNNAGSLYGNIIYHKAPIMMRQLEALLGKDKFREGMVEYIKTYAYKNADWSDLIEILDTKTPMDLKKWSDVWVNSPGRPVITGKISYNDDHIITSFKVEQKAEDGTEKIWPQMFNISLVYSDSVIKIPVRLYDKSFEVNLAAGLPEPDFIIFNSNGFGYGVFPADMNILKDVKEIKNDIARGYSYINCFENTLNGDIDPEKMFILLEAGVSSEVNELNLQLISNEMRSIYWHYLTEAQREDSKHSLEEIIYVRLLKKASPNIKKTLFGLYESVVYSDTGLDRLYRIWSKELSIPDLILNENDYTDLAMLLAVYGHPKSTEILESAEKAITNPDELDRFKFLLPSLSQDEQVRSKFFESFKEEKNREKENRVATACYYIHHPLRQKSAIKDLGMSLDLLEEIQRTGDIFFPKQWLDNTIGLYSSKEAYDILEEFMNAHPDLNPQLKMKLLQSADDLIRAQRLLHGSS